MLRRATDAGSPGRGREDLWLLAPKCSRCQRPALPGAVAVGECGTPPSVCPHPEARSVPTSADALRGWTCEGATPVRGVYLFPDLLDAPCSPECQDASLSEAAWASLRKWAADQPLEKLEVEVPPVSECGVLSLNCGSLKSKVHRLITLITLEHPDVVLLQEVWSAFQPSWLSGIPYAVFVGDLVDGGGLVMLVHRKHVGPSPPRVEKGAHCLCLTV